MALFKKREEEAKTEEKKENEETKKGVGLPRSRNSESLRDESAAKPPSEFSLRGKDQRLYRIIEKPLVTEKSVALAGQNKYVFRVSPKTNKVEVRKAIEKLYDVKVKNVRMLNVVGKKRQVGRFQGWKPGFKKAVVTLEKGYSIEVSHT